MCPEPGIHLPQMPCSYSTEGQEEDKTRGELPYKLNNPSWGGGFLTLKKFLHAQRFPEDFSFGWRLLSLPCLWPSELPQGIYTAACKPGFLGGLVS